MPSDTRRIDYVQAWAGFFRSPRWAMNFLLASVGQLIPVVGPIVVIGWLGEVVESLHTRPERTYPDFTFDRFGEYLTRGIWVYLVALLCSLAIMPVSFLFVVVLISARLLAGDNSAVIVMLMALIYALIALLNVAAGLVMIPLTLRAELMQQLGPAFSAGFVKDFIARVWFEMIVTMLLMNICAVPVMLAGFALCCVGVLPAMTLVAFAANHAQWQLYELYLSRGGTPIPVKTAPGAQAPVPPNATPPTTPGGPV